MTTEYQPNLSKRLVKTGFVTHKIRHFIAIIFAFTQLHLHAQQLNKPREIGISAAALGWTTINYTLQFTSDKIPSGRTWNLGKIDGLAVHEFRQNPKTISDITVLAAGLLSGASMMQKDQNQFWKNSVVMAQSVWLTANLAHSTKMLIRRNRPYTQQTGFQYSKRDDVYSFFSGHSAIASAFVTSALLMYPWQNQSFRGQKILLGTAGAAAATTMALRISAGKHYPTDVLAGALVGMGIAWFNYRIHAN